MRVLSDSGGRDAYTERTLSSRVRAEAGANLGIGLFWKNNIPIHLFDHSNNRKTKNSSESGIEQSERHKTRVHIIRSQFQDPFLEYSFSALLFLSVIVLRCQKAGYFQVFKAFLPIWTNESYYYKGIDVITKEKEIETQPSPAIQHSRTDTSLWHEAILPYLCSRLVLVLVGLLAVFYLLPLLKSNSLLPSVTLNTHVPDTLWLMWRHFDAGFYVDIAEHGYWAASTLHTASNWIFLPLYPLLMYPLGHLFGGSDPAFDIAGIMVANVAGLVAVSYLYLLVQREFDSRIAFRTVVYLALFPTSFYLSAIYPEAVFLACAIACIYYARQQRWWLAGICGALASLARIQGFLLVVPIVWEYWQVLSDRYSPLPEMEAMTRSQKAYGWLHSRLHGPALAAQELRNWFNFLAVVLIPLGLVPFLVYSKIKTGDFLATIHNHHIGWGRYIEYPWQLLANALSHPHAPDAMDWNFWLLNVIVILAFFGFTLWSWRRLPMIYTLFMAVMVLMPLTTASINSISRYYLVIFPAFMLLALWSNHERQPVRNLLIVNLFVALQAVFMIFFVLGLPLIA